MSRLRNTFVLAAIVVVVVLVGMPAWAFTVTVTANPTTVPEPGGVVEYTVTVTGPCEGEPFCQVVGLSYGDGDPCGTPSPIFPAGGSYECTFSRTVSGTPGSIFTTGVAVQGFGCADEAGVTCPTASVGLGTADVTITEGASSGDGGGARSSCLFPQELPSVREIERCTQIRIRDQHRRQDVPRPRSTMIVLQTGSTSFEGIDGEGSLSNSVPDVGDIRNKVKALLD